MNLTIDPLPSQFFPRRRIAAVVTMAVSSLLFLAGCGKSDNALPDVASASSTPAPSANLTTDRLYQYGTKINFGLRGNAAPYKISGWSTPEPESTWTEGQSATLSFAAPPPGGDIIFRATMSGFTKGPELPSQPVDVFVNGAPVNHWEIAVKGLAQMQIPANLVQDGKIVLEFKLPKAASPASLGVSVDQRRLGLCFYDLELLKP